MCNRRELMCAMKRTGGSAWLHERLQFHLYQAERIHAAEREIVIFGTGNTTALYGKCIDEEKLPVVAYADNNPEKQGTLYHGIPVVAPKEISKDSLVLVCSGNGRTNAEICSQLESMGLLVLPLDAYLLSRHHAEIMRCFGALDDEESRAHYADAIVRRMENGPVARFERHQYFGLPEFCGENGKETFVDLGAFVGDTVEQYLFERQGTFHKIYAFEPYEPNYRSMLHRFARLKLEWGLEESRLEGVMGAVGREEGCLSVAVGSVGSLGARVNVDGEGKEVHVHTIDGFFRNIPVGFIKADIESFEMDMLYGAVKVIARDRPKLAISIYHGGTDLFRIMCYLMNLDLNYKFGVRHHSAGYGETVLYAWTE